VAHVRRGYIGDGAVATTGADRGTHHRAGVARGAGLMGSRQTSAALAATPAAVATRVVRVMVVRVRRGVATVVRTVAVLALLLLLLLWLLLLAVVQWRWRWMYWWCYLLLRLWLRCLGLVH